MSREIAILNVFLLVKHFTVFQIMIETQIFLKINLIFSSSNIEIGEKNILIKGSRGMEMEEILKHIK